MKHIVDWFLRDLVMKRIYAVLLVIGMLLIAVVGTYALVPREMVQPSEVQPIPLIETPPSQPEDKPYYSVNEVEATIASSICSKLPERYKPFDRSGPRLGDKWIRQYDDFSAKYVTALYSSNGEWAFIARTAGAEWRSEYIGQAPNGAWQYRETDTTFVLEVEGTYYERIHKFDISRVDRLDEEKHESIREILL